jgi:hypothetical protein
MRGGRMDRPTAVRTGREVTQRHLLEEAGADLDTAAHFALKSALDLLEGRTDTQTHLLLLRPLGGPTAVSEEEAAADALSRGACSFFEC